MHDYHNYLEIAVRYLHIAAVFVAGAFREGFAHVNAVLGIIIALVAAFIMPAWRRIWAITLGATLVHLIAEVMLPVIANHERFQLPRNLLETSYWQDAFALYLGYLVVIAVFFFIKSVILPRGHH